MVYIYIYIYIYILRKKIQLYQLKIISHRKKIYKKIKRTKIKDLIKKFINNKIKLNKINK